jgi:exopolyphosphatase/guanosine-5'-triphosphate,3'-diphosphate pyrophosphatase
MKLAAIDIGSNTIRLQIVNVFEPKDKVSFKSLEFLRFPLRLSHDVFKKGKILPKTTPKFGKLMQTFRLLIELYEVDASFAVATSAMWEAENGQEIRDLLEGTTGIDIQIISGTEGARILNKAILPFLTEGPSIHIDVGGGSTEVNLYDGRELKARQSFRIGSVRKLEDAGSDTMLVPKVGLKDGIEIRQIYGGELQGIG